jgi:DNA/RNA endonuclease G (NUC1)
MAPVDLERFLWYIEARDADAAGLAPADAAARGSAVAVQLRLPGADGRPRPRTFLLTCAHVVRRCGDDALYAEILCFPPHKGYVRSGNGRRLGDAARMEARIAAVSALSPCAASTARDAAQLLDRHDWVLLDLQDVDFQGATAVPQWTTAAPGPGARVQVGGYPGGAGNTGDAAAWKDGHPVIATIFEALKVRRSPRAGMIGYSCDDIRPGVSGGGVFDAQGRLAGLHRQLDDAQGQRRAISTAAIHDWLAAHHGVTPLQQEAGSAPRRSLRRSALLLAAAVLPGVLLGAWLLAGKFPALGEREQVEIADKEIKPGDHLELPVQVRYGQLGAMPIGAPAAGLALQLRGSPGPAWETLPPPALDARGAALLQLRMPPGPGPALLSLQARDRADTAQAALQIDPAEIFLPAAAARRRDQGPALHLAYDAELMTASQLLAAAEADQAVTPLGQVGEADLLATVSAAGARLDLPAAQLQRASARVQQALAQQRRRGIALQPGMAGLKPEQVAALTRIAEAVARVQGPRGEAGGIVVAAGSLVFPAQLLEEGVSGCPPGPAPAALSARFASDLAPRPLTLRCMDAALRLALASFGGASPPAAPLAAFAADLDDRPLLLIGPAAPGQAGATTVRIAQPGYSRGKDNVAGWPRELLIHEAIAPDMPAGAALVDLHSAAVVGFHQGARWTGLRLQGAAVPAWQLSGDSPLAAALRNTPAIRIAAANLPVPDDDPLRLGMPDAQILGYDAGFLRAALPLPQPLPQPQPQSSAVEENLGAVLDYLHYSLRLHRQRRTAAFVAAHLDRTQRLPMTRSGIRWFDDPRSAAAGQPTAAQFRAGALRPQPLVAADLLGWGSLHSVADLALAAAYYRGNATAQYDSFHRRTWLALQRKIAGELHPESRRMALMAGPVLDPGDLFEGVLQIPQQFWLLAAYENPADYTRPHLHIFVARQYRVADNRISRLRDDEEQLREIAPQELESLSGLRFRLPGR